MSDQVTTGKYWAVAGELLSAVFKAMVNVGAAIGIFGLILPTPKVVWGGWVLFAIGGGGIAWIWASRKRHIQAMLDMVNRQHDTVFQRNPETCLGTGMGRVFFDVDKRRILHSDYYGAQVSVHDFSYIRAWRLEWETSAVKIGKRSVWDVMVVRMRFYTNEAACSEFQVRLPSMRAGQAWHQRLMILFSGVEEGVVS